MSSLITRNLIDHGFKPVTLEDKPVIKGYFQKENSSFSDYSFSMLYAWSASGTVFFRQFGETLLIARAIRGKIDFLYPPLGASNIEEFQAAISGCAKILSDIGKKAGESKSGQRPGGFSFKILSMDENKIKWAENLIVENYKVETAEDLPDYIYEHQKLIDLSGKKYKNKRENINKFVRSYPNYTIEPICEENIGQILKFLSRWYVENKPERRIQISELFDINTVNFEKNYILESYQSRRILRNFRNLDIKGECIKLYSGIVGFIIGEQTSSETFTVLIEKVDNNFFGLSQLLFREFLVKNASCEFINTSDDSGMPGLKVLKESYQPLYMKKRYFLSFISC
ncbi:MAG TPA: phosphatidylglycerol lysyltransferase domain-containing protein, partial [Candidatus Wallbacteria bacterium]|nr:phosphatidylglycerol lysyltransferase domain-containing protein [Candidatus Wallbacteria bacterium]